jgi:hypothetical protein
MSDNLLAFLMAEREKLSRAIQIFSPKKRRRGRPSSRDQITLPSPYYLPLLEDEHARLTRALTILGVQIGRRLGRPPKNQEVREAASRGRGWTADQRQAQADRMRQKWAGKRGRKTAAAAA